MYNILQTIHSYWAYLVVLVVALATIKAVVGYFSKKEYNYKYFRLALGALIVNHLQLLLGLILYFVSPLGFKSILNNGMAVVMKDSILRLYAVEHITVMLLATTLITIGYSKHKKKRTSVPKLKTLAIFYTLAFVLILSRIPWAQWL